MCQEKIVLTLGQVFMCINIFNFDRTHVLQALIIVMWQRGN